MALGFFRRRQKMVIIIMVVLMVSFLVGSYGFNMIFSRDPMAIEIARTRDGELFRRDWAAAQANLDILRSIGLGGMRYQPWPTDMEYMVLTRRNGQRSAEAYMLLLAEAKAMGVLVSEADVNTFFAEIGCSGDAYRQLVSNLRSSNRGWTEGMLRRAVADWLLINKAFAEANVGCPPSETELQATYRDLAEQIDVRVLRIKAADYVKDVPDPNEARIDAQFNMYRTRFAGQARKVGDMGFGYRQPGRARVEYLFIRGDVIERITEPPFDSIVDYYNRNKAEFVREVPITPPTPGTSQPANLPTRKVQMTFPEAKDQIAEKLRADTVQERLDEIGGFAEQKVRSFIKGNHDPQEAFAALRREMTQSADKALSTVLHGVKITSSPLDDAMTALAAAARLNAICYPWGTHGKQTLSPDVKVSLTADGITLGEALGRIGKQVKWPAEEDGKLHWAMCQGFKDVLFSVREQDKGVDFFPVTAGRTGMDTLAELSDDEILGYAQANPAGGRTLAQTVFSAKGLSTDPREMPMVSEGTMGPRMYVMGDKVGRLLWRLAKVAPAHVPASLTDRPALREKVIEDIKLQDAMKKAVEAAGKVKTAAETVGIETVAEVQKRKTVTTGLFTRKTQRGDWADVPGLDLDTRELRAYVIGKAFSLAPKNVEPNAPKGPPELVTVPIPLRAEVLAMERIDYKPVVRPEYEEAGRLITARFLIYARQQILQALWFDGQAIEQRVGYQKVH